MSSINNNDDVSHYVVTAHPPGAVLLTAKCNFLSSNSSDIIVAKSRTLEVRQLISRSSDSNNNKSGNDSVNANASATTSSPFPLVLTIPVNGRVVSMIPFQPKRGGSSAATTTSYLFLMLETHRYAIVSYDPNAKPYSIVTHASGSLKGDDVNQAILGREAECSPLVAIDPNNRCICIHLYDGLLTFIPINPLYDIDKFVDRNSSINQQNLLGQPYHISIEERTVLNIAFLHTNSAVDAITPSTAAAVAGQQQQSSNNYFPHLALLHQDSRCNQHIITHKVDLKKKELILYNNNSSSPATGGAKKEASSSIDYSSLIRKTRIDGASSLIIPVRMNSTNTAAATTTSSGGVLVIGDRQITYVNNGVTKIIPMPPSIIVTWDELPSLPGSASSRYLLGDENGNLHLLIVKFSNNSSNSKVSGLQLDTLGTCVIPSSIQYVSNDLLFVGSTFGDSQLIQIHDEPLPTMKANDDTGDTNSKNINMNDPLTYLSVIEEYTHLGPIVDFDLVPTQQQQESSSSSAAASSATSANATVSSSSSPSSTATTAHCQYQQSQVITASGTAAAGSLRLIRNGSCMNEYAAVDVPGIQNMWSIRKSFYDKVDTYLIQSFVGETRVLGATSSNDSANMLDDDDDSDDDGGTLEEVFLSGISSSASTLHVNNVHIGDTIVQITESEIRLIDSSSMECIDTWSPSSPGGNITVASATHSGQIVLALRGGLLIYLNVQQNNDGKACKIVHLNEKQMEREVSCINLNPFTQPATTGYEQPSNAMDIDGTGNVGDSSVIVAVGLWDDFTVRLLSLDTMQELLEINLSTGDDGVEDGGDLDVRNRNNMMARSLCLITLDSSSSSSGAKSDNDVSRGVSSNDSFTPSTEGVDMLFVGLGDGTLVSFAVDCNASEQQVRVRSRKEVSLGTQGINLVPLATEGGGSCVLATGDRPTVIYLAGGGGATTNPKLCYSNVNVASSDTDEDDGGESSPGQQSIAVSAATPFTSSLLFDVPYSGRNYYSLCLSDDSKLRLGVIDDIQKLHVMTCRLGMTPRRVVHCPEGRLFAVGCLDSGSSIFGDNDSMQVGDCIRFLDDATFDDIKRIDLEPHEMILSMAYADLSTVFEEVDHSTNESYTMNSYLLIGTAFCLSDEDEPTAGRIIVYSCTTDSSGENTADVETSSASRSIQQITELQVHGGVYSICQFYDGKVLASVNSKTQMIQLTNDGTGVLSLQILGIGHHGHILSLSVKSRAGRGGNMLLDADGVDLDESDSQAMLDETPIKSAKRNSGRAKQEKDQLAIVGDLMRSISLVQYYPNHKVLEEIARDFHSNWTTAVEMLTDNLYLGAETWNNLYILRRNTKSQSDEARTRLDTVGEFHLGEMVNKFMSGTLTMPQAVSCASSGGITKRARTGALSPKKGPRDGSGKQVATASRTRRPIVAVESQTLFATVDGTLGVILGLKDSQIALFFSMLERAMERAITPVGNFSHREFRAFSGEGAHNVHPAHNFVDGDLIESFLDLDRATMESIVKEMNKHGGWDAGREEAGQSSSQETANISEEMPATADENVLTVEDVLAMVEEMTMLH